MRLGALASFRIPFVICCCGENSMKASCGRHLSLRDTIPTQFALVRICARSATHALINHAVQTRIRRMTDLKH
jgi:hypothetical protein